MWFERFSKLPDGSIIRRVEEQLQLMTWKTLGDQSSIRVLREWPTAEEMVKQAKPVAINARQRATYEQSKDADGALGLEGLSW